jgi:DNA recombination protein RmuC
VTPETILLVTVVALGALLIGVVLGWLLGRGSRRSVETSFQAMASSALEGSAQHLVTLAEQRLASSRALAASDLEERRRAIETMLGPLQDTLQRLDRKTAEIEHSRVDAYSRLDEHLRQLFQTTSALQERTTSLTTALRGSSPVRGRWAEVQLENLVEMAGLLEHCDFNKQATIFGGRPDLVVYLPGERSIAVDAKAPMTAYWEASEATDDAVRRAAAQRHARELREHVKQLAARDYAGHLEGSVDFVVLFLPSEALLSVAFAEDPDLQVHALRSRVLLSTPTTLLALLRTAAYAWQQNSSAQNAAQISETAQELYKRLITFSEHFEDIGEHLGRAATAFNQAVGSFERRLVPLGNRLDALRVSQQLPKRLESPATVETVPRPVDGEG